MAESFLDVLSAAINEFIENGFDSAERLQYWSDRIVRSARATLTPETEMKQQLDDALIAIFRRMFEGGGLEKRAPGVPRYTIQRLEPQLRAELAKRIMASADLIKLNRDRAIGDTLRRFQGWASSVPAGGTNVASRRETKGDIKKALASLPFRDRRVIVDQGHKLSASLSEVVAQGNGAIAGEWHSHWRQSGYDYREDHKDRDKKIYLVRDSWAHEQGFVKPGKPGYYDDVTAVAVEPFCRCYMTWIFALRDLPADMLTAKGRAALKNVRLVA